MQNKNVREKILEKVLYTDFVTTESLVGVLLEKKEIKKAITRNNLYKFWGKIAGEKFAKRSKPYSMMSGGVMVVACENAIVAQELTLRKNQLLAKFEPYLKSLKLNVKDLRFDPKKWIAGIFVNEITKPITCSLLQTISHHPNTI